MFEIFLVSSRDTSLVSKTKFLVSHGYRYTENFRLCDRISQIATDPRTYVVQYVAKNKELSTVPDLDLNIIGVPPVRKYSNCRTLGING